MTRLPLPYDRPPITLNSRHPSRHARDAVIASVRRDVGWVARAARLGHHPHVTVELHYVPARRGRRDADNLVATLKPACDALVDVGLVDDDDPAHMTKPMPTIHPADPAWVGRRLWLEITPGPAPAPTGAPHAMPVPSHPAQFTALVTDAPGYTETDDRAFIRLLQGGEVPVVSIRDTLMSAVGPVPAPDTADPEPPDGEDGDGDDPLVIVSVAIIRPDGRQLSNTAVLPEPLAAGQLAEAVRACTSGVLAQAGETGLL